MPHPTNHLDCLLAKGMYAYQGLLDGWILKDAEGKTPLTLLSSLEICLVNLGSLI